MKTLNEMGVMFKVWWIPQVPGPRFEVHVFSPKEGAKVQEILAKYDQFQLDNRIKGDYCNAGGLIYSHSYLTKGKWWEFPEDKYELEELTNELTKWYEAHVRGEGWAC